ncbi:MAG: hypothetical protein QOK10_1096 [Pseudonocardiales bacterium]|nr:hypothetical protein [Pseudonocardiales bacterium]
MISYRYHLVSIIAIFLAIALGVVIGTSALNGAVVGDLHRQVTDLKQANAQAADSNKSLRAQSGNADLIAKSYGAKLAGGSLAKVRVVILGAPGASKALKDSVAAEVAAAGGTVAGRVQLSSSFTDPNRAADIRSLATSGAHPVGLQLPTNDDAGALAGSLLGFVLLGHGQATDITSVLAGFSTLNMLKTESGSVNAGKLLLLVAPGALPTGDAGGKTLLSMTQQLATTGGPTVVLGDHASSTAGGLVALVRGSDTAKQAVTTVDDADTALGQLTSVLAAHESLAKRNGQFGTAAGVDALMPGVSN